MPSGIINYHRSKFIGLRMGLRLLLMKLALVTEIKEETHFL